MAPTYLRGGFVVAFSKGFKVHINAVAVIVDSQNFLSKPASGKIFRAAYNYIHSLPRLFGRNVFVKHLTAATGINQMIKTDTINFFRLYEVENFI